MKIEIYATEYRMELSADIFLLLLEKLSPALQAKVRKYKRWQDAYGCLFGKLLLIRALRDKGFHGDLNELQYTEYGRPYLRDAPDFNISHSGNLVVCILGGEGPVGIDIEEIRELSISEFKDQFTAIEWQIIQTAKEPLLAFYHYWTAKESVLKANGKGLSISPATVHIETSQEAVLGQFRWKILTIDTFENYACHIAYEGPEVSWVVKRCLPNEWTGFGPLQS